MLGKWSIYVIHLEFAKKCFIFNRTKSPHMTPRRLRLKADMAGSRFHSCTSIYILRCLWWAALDFDFLSDGAADIALRSGHVSPAQRAQPTSRMKSGLAHKRTCVRTFRTTIATKAQPICWFCDMSSLKSIRLFNNWRSSPTFSAKKHNQ